MFYLGFRVQGLEGSWDLISTVTSTLIGVISDYMSIVTLFGGLISR